MEVAKAILKGKKKNVESKLLEFKRLTEEDWEQFKAIDRGCFPDDYIPKKLYLHYITKTGFIGFFRDGELTGYMFLQTANRYGLLNRIAVKRSLQGQGYGSIMMTYVIDYFKKRNVKKIELMVETKNKHAIALYKKYGFYFEQELWFYTIEEDHLKEIEKTEIKGDIKLQKLTLGDLNTIVETFDNINVEEMTKILENSNNLVLGLFKDKELKVMSVFEPNYAGCRSLKCKELKCFDEFIKKLKEYRANNYYNISFETNRQLAELCEQREFAGRRHLWKMEKVLEE